MTLTFGGMRAVKTRNLNKVIDHANVLNAKRSKHGKGSSRKRQL